MKLQSLCQVLGLSVLLSATPCFAAVVGSSQLVNFDNTSTSFSFNGSTFTLTDNNSGFSDPVNISTQGTGAVTSTTLFGLQPSVYFDPIRGSGSLVFDANTFTQYSAFADPTVIRFSGPPSFIGLRVGSDNNFFYGYAQFAGTLLKSYAFETTANLGIQAGAPITEVSAVPLPGAFALMLSGIGLFGVGMRNRRKLNLA